MGILIFFMNKKFIIYVRLLSFCYLMTTNNFSNKMILLTMGGNIKENIQQKNNVSLRSLLKRNDSNNNPQQRLVHLSSCHIVKFYVKKGNEDPQDVLYFQVASCLVIITSWGLVMSGFE